MFAPLINITPIISVTDPHLDTVHVSLNGASHQFGTPHNVAVATPCASQQPIWPAIALPRGRYSPSIGNRQL